MLWLIQKLDLRAGNRHWKTQRVEGEISIIQEILLGFLRSLGSAIINGANRSTMRRAEWAIAARRAVHQVAQRKDRSFVRECCKQNAIFSVTSYHNRSCLDNISTNQRYIVGFRHGKRSRLMSLRDGGNFEITLQIKKASTPNFQNSIFITLCEGWLQCIASVMQGLRSRLPTLQNRFCQIGNCILPECERLKFDHYNSHKTICAHWGIGVICQNLARPFCAQPCSVCT